MTAKSRIRALSLAILAFGAVSLQAPAETLSGSPTSTCGICSFSCDLSQTQINNMCDSFCSGVAVTFLCAEDGIPDGVTCEPDLGYTEWYPCGTAA